MLGLHIKTTLGNADLTNQIQFHISCFGSPSTLERNTDQDTVDGQLKTVFKGRGGRNQYIRPAPLPRSDLFLGLPTGKPNQKLV